MKNEINTVEISGFCGSDDTVRLLRDGTYLLRWTLISSFESSKEFRKQKMRVYSNKIKLLAFGKTAEFLTLTMKEGMRMAISGRLIHSLEIDGIEILDNTPEILVEDVVLLDEY